MDDKLKLQIESDNNYSYGKSVFNEFAKNNKLDQWVDKYLPFIDDESKMSIIKCYKEIYNNVEIN